MVLAGVSLGRYPHVCAFFEDRDEEFTCFLPFMREGIEAGEKAFHIVDPALRDEHLERLRRAGIATDETQRTGQLEVRGWTKPISAEAASTSRQRCPSSERSWTGPGPRATRGLA